MPTVLRLPDRRFDEESLWALVEAGAVEVEAEGEDLLGLFVGEPPPLPGARVEPALMFDQGDTWAASLRPFQVGPLRIAPLGQPGDLVLESGPAFGSGQHPSTRLVLDRLALRPPTGRVLDVGTGNGILALAALRLGAASAVGVDTDPAALPIAASNAARAGLSDRLELRADLPEQPFDLILVNIVADTVLDLAPALLTRLAPGGELCASGVSELRRAEVERGLRRLGLHVPGCEESGGWWRIDALASW